MMTPLNTLAFLESALLAAAKSCAVFDADFHPQLRFADSQFGDFQANGVLAFAKARKRNPRELAKILVSVLTAGQYLDKEDFSIAIAGPGFINFSLSPQYLQRWLQTFSNEEQLRQSATRAMTGKTIVVDYSSPNTAKQMHVGHLRSLVIGEAIQRLLRFHGARVIRDNHLGDWGTQFGILLMAIRRKQYDLDATHADPLEDLEQLYRSGMQLFKADPQAQAEARHELAQLQQGDPERVSLWQKISKVSWQAFQEIYDRMGVTFDTVRGESSFRDSVDRVVEELQASEIAEMSEGALVVFHRDHARFKDFPFIILKQDGTTNYGTTDLATALASVEQLHANSLIYVTDGRQQDHFQQLFLTVERWFRAKGYSVPEMRHIWFGTILGKDGKAIKTREGTPIRLKALLQEAVDRALAIVRDKNPHLPAEEQQRIAEVVGLGAVRYTDLAQNRTSDYVFSWEKMLAFEGNTAPYLLYAVARIHSIFRKRQQHSGQGEEAASPLTTDPEIRLAQQLIRFPIILEQAVAELRPHIICTYLFELAGTYSTFYNADKVLAEDPAVQARRLQLCARTLMVLETGLHLLGLETLERM